MTITIKEQEYNIKYTLRSIFLFEEITGKHFDVKTTLDEYIFFYSLIMANNKDMQLTFDEFIDVIDEEPTLIKTFADFLSKEFKINGQLKEEKSDGEKN